VDQDILCPYYGKVLPIFFFETWDAPIEKIILYCGRHMVVDIINL